MTFTHRLPIFHLFRETYIKPASKYPTIPSKLSGPGSSVGMGPGMEYQCEARFSAPVRTGPGAHLASCTMGTGSFPGVKSGRSVTLTTHSLLAPWSRKSRAIPLLPLRAVRPVQSPSHCTRVHFSFFYFTVNAQNV